MITNTTVPITMTRSIDFARNSPITVTPPAMIILIWSRAVCGAKCWVIAS